MPSLYESWDSQEHPGEFDNLRFVPTFALKRVYESFNEVQLLSETASNQVDGFSVLEVGCATGELYRYLSFRYPKVSYTGCDISEPAIERARTKFPNGAIFHIIDKELDAVSELQADIVFCRDVVHHQTDPFAFLEKLYRSCTKTMIIRTRTRDAGASVLDPELSCQYVYGTWVPFMVLNCDDIVSELTKMEPRPARIKLVKDYVVLGGSNQRYLPKGCYEESTGTAVTALLIERGEAEQLECRVEQEVREERSGHSRLGRVTRRSIERFLGRGYGGSTWW